MNRDPNAVLEELERQWDLSQEAAEAALDDWYLDEAQPMDPELMDAVLKTQQDQRGRYHAVRSYKKKHSV